MAHVISNSMIRATLLKGGVLACEYPAP